MGLGKKIANNAGMAHPIKPQISPKVNVKVSEIKTIKALDTDFVLTLKNGKRIIIKDGVINSMMDPTYTIELADQTISGQSALQGIGYVDIKDVSSISVGTPDNDDENKSSASSQPPTATATATSSSSPVVKESHHLSSDVYTLKDPPKEVIPVQNKSWTGEFSWLTVGVLSALSLVGLASLSKSGGGGGSNNNPSPTPSTGDSYVTGVVTAGVVVGKLHVAIYKADGSNLLGEGDTQSNGLFNIKLSDSTYTGAILAVVTDTYDKVGDPSLDFIDEATRVSKDLTTMLLTVSEISSIKTTTYININPLTTLGALKAGVTIDDDLQNYSLTIPLSVQSITTSNQYVKGMFGLSDDIIKTDPITTIDRNGNVNLNTNAIGKALATLSEIDTTQTSMKNTLEGVITGTINNTTIQENTINASIKMDTLVSNGSDIVYVVVDIAGSDIGGGTVDFSDLGGSNATSMTLQTSGPYSGKLVASYEISNSFSTQQNKEITFLLNDKNNTTLITQNPLKLSYTTTSIILHDDSGIDGTDNITNNGLIDIHFDAFPASWQYSVDNGSTWLNSTGNTFVLSEGEYHGIKVRSFDSAHNTSIVTLSENMIIDKTLPALPKITFQSDTGSSSSDSYTNDGTVNVEIDNDDVSIWQYSTNGGSTWTTGSSTNHQFSILQGDYLANDIQVKVQDLAGNSAIKKYSSTITVDQTAQALTSSYTDTGAFTNDNITQDGKITIGNTENGATWEYSLNGGTTWSSGSGNYVTLAERTYGANSIKLRQTDKAGNISNVSIVNSTELMIDTTVTLMTSLYTDTGSSSIDNITNNKTITVGGIENGATWQYSLDSGVTWSTGIGTTFSLADNVTYVSKSIQVRQNDKAGNISEVKYINESSSLTTDTSAPLGATFSLASDTGSSSTDWNTTTGTINVDLKSDAIWKWEYSTNNGTSWNLGYGTTFTLSAGVYNTGYVKVRKTDIAGNQTITSTTTQITIDPNNIIPTLSLASNTGQSSSDTITKTPTINVGSLDSGALWWYQLDGGTWTQGAGTSFSATVGTHTYSVKQTDLAGNVSSASTPVSFTYDNTAPTCTITTTLPSAQNGMIKYDFVFNENVYNFTSASLTLTEGTKGTFTKTDESHYSLLVTAKADVGATLTLPTTVYDIAGNSVATQNVYVSPAGQTSLELTGLNLINPINLSGKWYYFLDNDASGTVGIDDQTTHNSMDTYFKKDSAGATNPSPLDTTDAYRYYTTAEGVKLALPTKAELETLFADLSGSSLPTGSYWSSTNNGASNHYGVDLSTHLSLSDLDTTSKYVLLQVI